ncbi:AAA family ATPase [Vibrio sp. RE88]|uniref:AAA family ATPase n=1 Tax=Vibrio sp. RE88 TaxID=2607610 RepID=UPI0014936FE1|nr:AAA family ATPase [Vibrio sp. RE88]NOH60314.1 AAA family ATPase [Vibrio sp. RE88]
MTTFKNLKVTGWNQFGSVDISFDKRFTILTGANGSGKTTLLKLLAHHCQFLSDLHYVPQEGQQNFIVSVDETHDIVGPARPVTVAALTTTNGKIMHYVMPFHSKSATYQSTWQNMTEHVPSIFIPSARQSFAYTKASNIQPVKLPVQAEKVVNIQGASRNVAQEMKNKLINWAVTGFGNQVMPADDEARLYYEGFQSLLKEVLPRELKFSHIKIVNFEVVMYCEGGSSFLLESVSSGIGTLISIAWQLFQYKFNDEQPFVIMIDEVEAHLHPKMQREILHSLAEAFPRASFIVSTHSPLVINSVEDAAIYVLAPNEAGKIESTRLDFQNFASTANGVLDEVLGVSSTYPIWVEEKLTEIVNRYSSMQAEEIDFEALKSELSRIGLNSAFLPTMTSVMENMND